MSRIELRQFDSQDLAQVYHLLAHHGWAHRIHSEAEFARLVAYSQCNVVAVCEHQVISYARAITDGISNGYISMLIVKPEYQRQGVGQALTKEIIKSAPTATWVLRAGREGAAAFFEKVGFQVSSIAMERNRKS